MIEPLRRGHLHDDPLAQFEAWFEAAVRGGVGTPEAAALATATPAGAPSLRMVLVKGVDARGFRFFTGYESRKGAELAANPHAALLFHWEPLGRQVRVEGRVDRLPASESDEYFTGRPRGSRLSALASRQSEPIARRRELEQLVAALDAAHPGEEVPRPERWGGLVLAPAAFEFWQHRDDRLHDRFRYLPDGRSGWTIERLQP